LLRPRDGTGEGFELGIRPSVGGVRASLRYAF